LSVHLAGVLLAGIQEVCLSVLSAPTFRSGRAAFLCIGNWFYPAGDSCKIEDAAIRCHPWPPGSSMRFLIRTLTAFFQLTVGMLAGAALLEGILRINPPLLAGLRGLAAPAPLDPPLTAVEYDVHYSDGDQLFWRPDLVRPVATGDDRLEAHVVFQTDEFGFRNDPPLPARADLVVLGRSFSLGAQSSSPWPAVLKEQTGWRVINLAEPGSTPEVKRDFLLQFGLPRRPRWVIVEVAPPIDALNYHPSSPTLVQMIPTPLVQEWARRFYGIRGFFTGEPIYPLAVDLPGRTYDLTCCVHYLDALTLTEQDWRESRGWREFTAAINRIAEEAGRHKACIAVLYAPTKPEIYFPLALDPAQLEPALRGLIPLRLDRSGELVPDPDRPPDILALRANAMAARDALSALARENGLVFVDPTGLMVQSVLEGRDPFMTYDSHWNALGHALVARAVAEALLAAECG
jgi:hypothetical protein